MHGRRENIHLRPRRLNATICHWWQCHFAKARRWSTADDKSDNQANCRRLTVGRPEQPTASQKWSHSRPVVLHCDSLELDVLLCRLTVSRRQRKGRLQGCPGWSVSLDSKFLRRPTPARVPELHRHSRPGARRARNPGRSAPALPARACRD